jgi:hypothetical protein
METPPYRILSTSSDFAQTVTGDVGQERESSDSQGRSRRDQILLEGSSGLSGMRTMLASGCMDINQSRTILTRGNGAQEHLIGSKTCLSVAASLSSGFCIVLIAVYFSASCACSNLEIVC